jgi:hypothetical protein
MNRVLDFHSPDDSPVKIKNIECCYKPSKEPTTLSVGVPEGVHAQVVFEVAGGEQKAEKSTERDWKPSTGRKAVAAGDIEAVEFTFILYDVFDRYIAGVQGLAGPGIYRASKKSHKSKWIFDVDGGFSLYHALCFPSQVRLMDGTVWRCDRPACVRWLNERMKDSGEKVTVDDVFIDGGMHEGRNE